MKSRYRRTNYDPKALEEYLNPPPPSLASNIRIILLSGVIGVVFALGLHFAG
jgi:hypothetical protein